MSLIRCENISLAYDGKSIISSLSFAVNSGDYLFIVGENGSGKTTLMKGLLGLIKPVGGKIVFGDGLIQTEIGYLPQQTLVQKDFPASVNEVVLSGCQNRLGRRFFYTKKEKETAKLNMNKLGINGKLNFNELSGGQRQRALLARALCATQKLILLDEPTAGLDPVVTSDFYQITNGLNKNHNITVIMVSHDLKAALKYATHILHINNDSVFFGTKDEYVKSESAQRFLGGK